MDRLRPFGVGVCSPTNRHSRFEDLMFPTPKPSLTPNTYAYEVLAAGEADRLP